VSNVKVQMMALAISLGEMLWSMSLCSTTTPFSSGCYTWRAIGVVAIRVQVLNDMLVSAYSSGSSAGGRRSPGEARKRLFGGSIDEKAQSMMVMLQDSSRYLEGSWSGKVMLFKGKEN
jgi:hypothetical protein